MNTNELTDRVAELTRLCLEDGASPSQVAFALVSVATDMGLHVGGDPRQVFAVLLGAIAKQASEHSAGIFMSGAPPGATLN